MTVANSNLANALGRPDLAPAQGFAMTAAAPVAGQPGQQNGSGADLFGGLSGSANFQGRMSLAMIGAIVVGLAAVYIWTREYQR